VKKRRKENEEELDNSQQKGRDCVIMKNWNERPTFTANQSVVVS
jgi:hypothetical protein